MSLFRRCCCCSLRMGAFLVAGYSFMESLICMSLFLVRYIFSEFLDFKAEYEVITYSMLASFGLLTIFAALLFVGIKMEYVVLFIPWMILRILLCFYCTICGISLVYIQSYHFQKFIVWDSSLVLVLFYTAGFGIYLELVILSYYEHIRDSKARRQRRRLRRLTREGTGQAVVPSNSGEITGMDLAVLAAALHPSTIEPPRYEENPPPYYQEDNPNPGSLSHRNRNPAS